MQLVNGPAESPLSARATAIKATSNCLANSSAPMSGNVDDEEQESASYLRRLKKRKKFAWKSFGKNKKTLPPAVEKSIGSEDEEEVDDGDVDNNEKRISVYPWWRMTIDPSSRFAYWWSCAVSVAFLYNFWVIVYRFEFHEIRPGTVVTWFALDYGADAVYALDIAFRLRSGYLEDGILQTDGAKMRAHYMKSSEFFADCLCLLPLDFLYLVTGFNSLLRLGRILKIYRFLGMCDHIERHTNFPNFVRTMTLLHGLFSVFHWNACLVSMVHRHQDTPLHWWPGNQSTGNLTADRSVGSSYIRALYKSTLILTLAGKQLPEPETKIEYLFVFAEIIFALFLFAFILGHVANIVTSVSAARKEFQGQDYSASRSKS